MEREEVGLKGERNLRSSALHIINLAFEDKTIVIASGCRIYII